jgi:NAD(P)-dependent dehydrogenase (short-subunit alcohol dehydrogenase family)
MATVRAGNHDLRSTDLFDVSHVTALVTGGATGIGLMITQALVANGAKVYITGRREETLEKTVEQYNKGAGSLQSLVGDVSSKEGCLKLAEELGKKEPQGIQLLVNNAGVARDDETKFSSNGEPDMSSAESISKHFLRSDGQQWTDTFTTNVAAQYFMSSKHSWLMGTTLKSC